MYGGGVTDLGVSRQVRGILGLESDERRPFSDGELLSEVSEDVRQGFVRKVYILLCAQLMLTTMVGAVIFYACRALAYDDRKATLSLLLLTGTSSCFMAVMFICFPRTMRLYPFNYVLLTFFAIGQGLLVGLLCVWFDSYALLVASTITIVAVMASTFMSLVTKTDFSGRGAYLGMGCMVMGAFGFFLMLCIISGLASLPAFRPLHLAYPALGALLFCVYVVLDTQLIIGGKHHKFEFCADDFPMASLTVFLDIFELFVFVIQSVGKRHQ